MVHVTALMNDPAEELPFTMYVWRSVHYLWISCSLCKTNRLQLQLTKLNECDNNHRYK